MDSHGRSTLSLHNEPDDAVVLPPCTPPNRIAGPALGQDVLPAWTLQSKECRIEAVSVIFALPVWITRLYILCPSYGQNVRPAWTH